MSPFAVRAPFLSVILTLTVFSRTAPPHVPLQKTDQQTRASEIHRP
jgi:hypothetical protein